MRAGHVRTGSEVVFILGPVPTLLKSFMKTFTREHSKVIYMHQVHIVYRYTKVYSLATSSL